MKNLALVLACLACTHHGQPAQISGEQFKGSALKQKLLEVVVAVRSPPSQYKAHLSSQQLGASGDFKRVLMFLMQATTEMASSPKTVLLVLNPRAAFGNLGSGALSPTGNIFLSGLQPLHLDRRRHLGHCILALDEFEDDDDVVELLTVALDESPDAQSDAGLLAHLGTELATKGKHSEAALQLEASLALDPNQGETLTRLAYVHGELCQPQKALECYRRAIEVDPSEATNYLRMGAVLHRLGSDTEAFQAAQTAVRLDPSCEDEPWSLLGAWHHMSGDLDAAQKAFSNAVAESPSDAIKRRDLADVLRDTGFFAESYSQLCKAQQLAAAREIVGHAHVFAPANLATVTGSPISMSSAIVAEAAKGGQVAAQLRPSALPQTIPSEWIERLSRVYITHVATDAECEWAIETAEKHAASMGGWEASAHHEYAKTNNIVVAENMELSGWVQEMLRNAIWPAIKAQFDIDVSELWLEDCFLAKYDTKGQAGLEQHVDESELSFNLLLSDPASFQGGGTAFIDAELKEVTVRPNRGELLTHFGRLYHEGKPVVGEAPRYILAGFVRAEPLARRWREFRIPGDER